LAATVAKWYADHDGRGLVRVSAPAKKMSFLLGI